MVGRDEGTGGRWIAAALLAAGVLLATYGWLNAWAVPPVRDYDLDLGWRLFAGWMWLIGGLGAAGALFGMVVARRRNYLPPTVFVLTIAVAASVGLILAVSAVHHAHGKQVQIWDPHTVRQLAITVELTLAPWLTLAGFVALIAGTVWLAAVSAAVRRRVATDLAAVEREQRRRDGLIEHPDEPPVPRV
jgi:hypothetical protein